MTEQKRLMELRAKIAKKRPKFRRVESWRYKRVKDSWRKARGIDSKTRRKSKSGVKSPSVGYRGPKKVRGIHPSGFQEIRIETKKDLQNLNKKKHIIKVSSRLGSRKRIALIDYCQKRGFKILNLGISQKEIEALESMIKAPISELEDEEFVDTEQLEDSFNREK